MSKRSDPIDGGPRTYMCEAATELDTGGMPKEVCRRYAGLYSNTPTQPCNDCAIHSLYPAPLWEEKKIRNNGVIKETCEVAVVIGEQERKRKRQ